MFPGKSKYRLIAISFLITGALFIAIGSWQAITSSQYQEKALELAKSKMVTKTEPVTSKKESYVKGDVIGVLQIPRIKAELPIIEGTGEEELKGGVGHYIGTSFPSQNNQIVLSGHRDTVFQKVGELSLGDQIIMEMPDGKYKYEITHTKIVDAEDRTVIRSTAPKEELVLTTCYPFHFIGNAPERYIVYAKPVF